MNALAARVAALPLPIPVPSIDWEALRAHLQQYRARFARLRRTLGAIAAGALMSVTHTTATRNTIVDTVTALLNAGTPPGHIIMATAGAVTVATLTLSNASFGASSGGTATAAAITDDTNAVGGTIALAIFKNAAGTEIFRCSVTATGGGGDITFNSVVVSAGQTVSLTSLTYAGPA